MKMNLKAWLMVGGVLSASAGMATPATGAAPMRPLMGWASWNSLGCDISEEIILAQAEAMVKTGLRDAGYRYINLDDGAFGGRDAQGHIKPHPTRFPNGFKAMVAKIHAMGLKVGTYSDAGDHTCAGLFNGDTLGMGTGLWKHEQMDAHDRFIDDGFDFIKVDWCGGRHAKLDEREQYTRIANAIRSTGRKDVMFNVCRWCYPGTWISGVADSWRTGGDIRANWGSLRGAIMRNLYLAPYCSFGHYNDMDMMQVGRLVGKTKPARFREFKSDTGLTLAEETTHFGLWCILSSPLAIGCDLREIPESTVKLLTNPELLSMSQNDLGLQASVVWRDGDLIALAKDADELYGKSRFVALFNASNRDHTFELATKVFDLGGKVAIRDLAARADLAPCQGTLKLAVAPHETKFLKLTAAERLDREVYEAEDAFLTAYQELRNKEKAGTAYARAHRGASGGWGVGWLGRGAGNDLVWPSVRVTRGGNYTFALSYVSCEDRKLFMQIDGGEPVPLATPKTDKFTTLRFSQKLSAGTHKIRLFNETGWMADVDCLKITLEK